MGRKHSIRYASAFVLILCFVISGTINIVFADEKGELTVQRVWEEGSPQGYHFSYALVSWENTTHKTFKQVTIQAIAYSPDGKMINESHRSFFAHERGPIMPGFTGTLKIPVDLNKSNFSNIKCSVTVLN